MSNIKELKASWGYTEKPALPICSNCKHFRSELVLPAWIVERNKSADENDKFTVERHGVEKNMNCNLHKFPVKKTASCYLFTKKEKAE